MSIILNKAPDSNYQWLLFRSMQRDSDNDSLTQSKLQDRKHSYHVKLSYCSDAININYIHH